MRMPTVPGVFPAAMTSATAGYPGRPADEGEPADGPLHFHGIAGVVLVREKAEMKIAPSTPTLSIAATIVTRDVIG